MGSTTSKGYPYPSGNDRVRDGDDAIKALATAVDSKVGLAAVGIASVTTPASGAGTTAVTFPGGRFTEAPVVMVTLQNTGSVISAGTPTATGITKNGFTVSYNRGSAATFSLGWIAHQV